VKDLVAPHTSLALGAGPCDEAEGPFAYRFSPVTR
jgi:hypothetical protein